MSRLTTLAQGDAQAELARQFVGEFSQAHEPVGTLMWQGLDVPGRPGQRRHQRNARPRRQPLMSAPAGCPDKAGRTDVGVAATPCRALLLAQDGAGVVRSADRGVVACSTPAISLHHRLHATSSPMWQTNSSPAVTSKALARLARGFVDST